ncbi:8316_t:CDS:2 [Ambispora gerdemannii]|uniref:8316_t:CDS:1 n=1 Tax=Ambispora gerdemannii TaxID=144530 RepID=A0A9N8V4P2_9GLOM|nr:8316_t:CDS:2 [Ambispora gerdemannii]
MAASSTAVVELGFAEPPAQPLTSEKFPSKIGGKPAWLNPKHILSADKVECGVCKKPMILLLQLYTPEDYPPEAFHRMIYVFCCKNGSCHKLSWRESFKVYRSQLSRDNPYWPVPPSTSSEELEDSNQENIASELAPDNQLSDRNQEKLQNDDLKQIHQKLNTIQCIVCGLLGSKTCGKCNIVRYCSKAHQIEHWITGQHKTYCSSIDLSSNPTENDDKLCQDTILFPEYEIVNESETDRDGGGEDDENRENEISQENSNSRALVPVGDETYEESQVNVDKAFLQFQRKVELNPDQVLRYARVEYEADRNPDPLWVSEHEKPDLQQDIPACPYCSNPRTFEFQILSTLLNYLKIDHTKRDSLDWGTLLVYSCKGNCYIDDEKNLHYLEEYIWRQNFSEEGVQLDQR